MTARILIIGVGSIGERHVRCFRHTGQADVSICEVNEAHRRRVAEAYSIGRAYDSLDAALSAMHDAAVIATPAHTHIPMAQRCVDAGLHLLIEKPLALTLEGVDALNASITDRNLKVAVAYVWRCNPLLQLARRAIVDGRFGRPLQIAAACGQHFPKYRPAYRDIYYRDRATGGGAIQDAMTHLLNAGEWLVGPTTSLLADAKHMALDGVSVEDTVHLIARHDQVMGSYVLNQHQAPNEATITVVCERGTVRVETHERRWRWMTEPGGAWHDEYVEDIGADAPFVAQANQFLDVLHGTGSPPCTFAEGIQTLKAIRAALASSAAPAWATVG